MNQPVTYNPFGITWLQSILIVVVVIGIGLVIAYIQHRRGK